MLTAHETNKNTSRKVSSFTKHNTSENVSTNILPRELDPLPKLQVNVVPTTRRESTMIAGFEVFSLNSARRIFKVENDFKNNNEELKNNGVDMGKSYCLLHVN